MANAIVDWRGSKPTITYGYVENRVRMPIRSIVSMEVGGLSSDSEEDESDRNKKDR